MSLASEWKSYRDEVMPRTAGEVQRQETRNAFYAGAAAVWRLVSDAAAQRDAMEEPSEAPVMRAFNLVEKDLFQYRDELLALAIASKRGN